MSRRCLLGSYLESGGGIGIDFYIGDIYCQAESGMTFSEWIMSDYYDITNPYGFMSPDGSDDIRNFILNYGIDNELTNHAGFRFSPRIFLYNLIIPNQTYTLNVWRPI